MNIQIRNVPDDIFKVINKKRIAHMARCRTCKYGLGIATIAYIRELIKENNELKKGKPTTIDVGKDGVFSTLKSKK